MNRIQKKYLHLLVGIVIIILSLYYAFRGVSFTELGNALNSVYYIYLFPAIFLVAVSYLLRAMRWRYLIRSIKEVKTTALLSPLLVGYMANMLPARAGEFIRAYLLSKKEQISFSTSFATIFIEKLFDLILVLLLLAYVLIFLPEAFASGDMEGKYQMVDKIKIFGEVSLSLCLFILLFFLLLQFKNDWAMKMVGFFVLPFPQKWKDKILNLVNSFSEGLKIIRDVRGFIAVILLSFLIWTIFIVTNYPLYMAFDIQNELPISSLVVLCVTVAIFIAVAPTPGFLGSYQIGCVAALHGIFGIQKAVALSYGIVAWLTVMGFTVIVGMIFALKENISLRSLSVNRADRIE